MVITVDDLSLNQIAALRQVASGRNIPFDIWKTLLYMDLVDSEYDEEDIVHDVLTVDGWRLLYASSGGAA